MTGVHPKGLDGHCLCVLNVRILVSLHTILPVFLLILVSSFQSAGMSVSVCSVSEFQSAWDVSFCVFSVRILVGLGYQFLCSVSEFQSAWDISFCVFSVGILVGLGYQFLCVQCQNFSQPRISVFVDGHNFYVCEGGQKFLRFQCHHFSPPGISVCEDGHSFCVLTLSVIILVSLGYYYQYVKMGQRHPFSSFCVIVNVLA